MPGMGFLEASGLAYRLDDGRELFHGASFRVSTGQIVALVGANGVGKTTLLRILAGELRPTDGGVSVQGGLGVMPQFVGSLRDDKTVRDLLLAVASPAVRAATTELDAAELALMETDDQPTQLRYAHALQEYAEAGGYTAEVLWDTVTVAALGVPFDRARFREVKTLSGGEQKRLVLEALLRGQEQVLLLDEPDNYLDVPGKRWLEQRLADAGKAVLLISHDRELLAAVANPAVPLGGEVNW